MLYEANPNGFWTRVRLPPGPPKENFMNETELKLREMYMQTARSIVHLFEKRIVKFSSDGPDMVSTGSRVGKWTAR